ncbi:hypothetical protein BUALT_Bualt11G0088800 [Buddleja alternifolia]|uniref:Clp R domain-containing protein n=1 Tax=Buddleja alternifolia TaxID=168488 RepID=A0AAV6X0Q8_9LAMI|nr:hypothetical protein BUALT_Bualt11G0088800 [Buddleja alternifolia]
MRAGSCAVQRALTAEAAAMVKQAVVLAKRRGHVQVTPLHVANTMLSAPSGSLRAACLKSHSHPLQCKALELCFNVALNRLPASSSSSPFTNLAHHQYPSISNALVAAFKRAQAHQRRGSIENQQTLLTVKIELEQLVISILDDPSVSRVMREAGFSSTQVKRNLEKSLSLELSCSRQTSPSPLTFSRNEEYSIRNEDVDIIIENLLLFPTKSNYKNLAVVGESISNTETVVKALMNRVDKGEVPEGLKEVKFITIPPFYTFCNLRREEVERKIGELSCLVKSLVRNGVVLYLGDLKWISDYRVKLEQEKRYLYCSVEHMIMEIGRMVWGIGQNNIGRVWMIGIATFQSYMKCRSGFHSLESVWGLHLVTIPANSLGLSLLSESDVQIEATNGKQDNRLRQQLIMNEEVKLICCDDCMSKLEAEARSSQTSVCNTNEPTLSNLPPWLKDEKSRRLTNSNNKNCHSMEELCKKWNSYCSSAHMKETLNSFDEQINPNLPRIHFPSTPNSASSSEIMDMEYTQKFKEFKAENLNILCNALEKKVPWQREIIPEVSGTILQCRSGMLRRKHHLKEETWLFFLGFDSQAKLKISRELAKVVFGSYSNFLSIGLSSDFERFAQEVFENPHRVFYIDDFKEADYCLLKKVIERGRILRNGSGEEVRFCDAIIVLSCESFDARSRAAPENGFTGSGEEKKRKRVSLDLNICFDDESSVENDRIIDHELENILESVDRSVVFN